MTRFRRRRPRHPRRIVIGIEQLLAADAGLAKQDAMWRADGYEVSSARLWRCKDRTFTARVVWRNRAALVSTITCTVQGIVLR